MTHTKEELQAMNKSNTPPLTGKTIVVWFSCGAASAVAAKKTVEKYGASNTILIVNNPVAEEHEDNQRFLKDVEKWIGLPIIQAINTEVNTTSAVEIWEKRKYMAGVKGAPCTMLLKKQARYEFELKHKIDYHVLGFTKDEQSRHDRFTKFERENVLPILIDAEFSKTDCFEIIESAGIELPYIYKLGYPNANCIGCVKSSSPTYWNLVREKHPEVFEQRAEQSKRIKCKLVKIHAKYLPWLEKVDGMYRDKDTLKVVSKITKKGKVSHMVREYLSELPANAKGGKIKSYECGIFCDTK